MNNEALQQRIYQRYEEGIDSSTRVQYLYYVTENLYNLQFMTECV